MITTLRAAGASLVLLGMAVATPVAAVTIDFSTLAAGTVVDSQFAGLTFSLSGGPSTATAPIVGYGFFDSVLSLNNSGVYGLNTNGYPTGSLLTVDFAAATGGISFTFHNYGSGNGSVASFYDASNTLIGSLAVDGGGAFSAYNFGGSGVRKLVFSNGSNGNFDWIFGIGQLTYGAVPEPASWAMLIAGFGLVGAVARRKRVVVAV
jgi:PEP-CTERM motif